MPSANHTIRTFVRRSLAAAVALGAAAMLCGAAPAQGRTPGVSGTEQAAPAATGDRDGREAPGDEETCCCMDQMGYGCKVAGDPGCKYSRINPDQCKEFAYGCVAEKYCGG